MTHSNGHSVAPIFGQNHANARFYMDISPKNRCHKPSWQGCRPPAPNGQCPNELLYFYGGASLNSPAEPLLGLLVTIEGCRPITFHLINNQSVVLAFFTHCAKSTSDNSLHKSFKENSFLLDTKRICTTELKDHLI